MNPGIAALSFVVGIVMLTIGVLAPSVQVLADIYQVGLPEGETGLLVIQCVGFGLGGVGLVSGGIGLVSALMDPRGSYAPYIEALDPLAAEHGRNVEIDGRNGLGFVSLTEGPRVEFMVRPKSPGFVNMWVESPGSQRLLFLPISEDTIADDPEWRRVGARDGWVLRAELPSAARGFMEEPGLASDLSRLFSLPQVRAVRHDGRGLEVISELLPPADLRTFVHAALGVSRRLRRFNS